MQVNLACLLTIFITISKATDDKVDAQSSGASIMAMVICVFCYYYLLFLRVVSLLQSLILVNMPIKAHTSRLCLHCAHI